MLNLAYYHNSLARSTKSTQSPSRAPTVCKHMVSGSFSLPSRGSFHLSLTVLFSIGRWVVFSLGGWSPRLPTRFLVSRGTLDHFFSVYFSSTGLLLFFGLLFQVCSTKFSALFEMSTPGRLLSPVWALSLSLAATYEIDVSFFSSGYLDVSVLRVPFP